MATFWCILLHVQYCISLDNLDGTYAILYLRFCPHHTEQVRLDQKRPDQTVPYQILSLCNVQVQAKLMGACFCMFLHVCKSFWRLAHCTAGSNRSVLLCLSFLIQNAASHLSHICFCVCICVFIFIAFHLFLCFWCHRPKSICFAMVMLPSSRKGFRSIADSHKEELSPWENHYKTYGVQGNP